MVRYRFPPVGTEVKLERRCPLRAGHGNGRQYNEAFHSGPAGHGMGGSNGRRVTDTDRE